MACPGPNKQFKIERYRGMPNHGQSHTSPGNSQTHAGQVTLEWAGGSSSPGTSHSAKELY